MILKYANLVPIPSTREICKPGWVDSKLDLKIMCMISQAHYTTLLFLSPPARYHVAIGQEEENKFGPGRWGGGGVV